MQGFAGAPETLLPAPTLQTNRSNGVPSQSELGHRSSHIPICTVYSPSRSSPMLKLLSSSACLRSRAQHALTEAPSSICFRPANSPLLRALNSLRGLSWRSSGSGQRVFFCSDSSGDRADAATAAEGKIVEAESEVSEKSSSAIVSTNPRPEDYLTVGLNG